MKRNFVKLLIIIISLWLTSCAVGKHLDTPVYLFIEGPQNVNTSSESQKYLVDIPDNYKNTFYNELSAELSTFNIIVVGQNQLINSNSYKTYSLKVENLNMNESYSIETIYRDSLSLFAETFYVTSCNVAADFDIYQSSEPSNGYLIKSCAVSSGKDEKLNTNRTFWQIVFGTNKDNSEYTYHELSSDVFYDLCSRTARKTAAKTSRVLSKQ